MSREELIGRWKEIAKAVFVAEQKVLPEWRDRLKSVTKDNLEEVSDAYLTAIAEEILSKSDIE